MLSALERPKECIRRSGCHYHIDRVLQEETFPLRQVYSTTANSQKFMLKYIHEVNFTDLQDIDNRLRGTANHVRLVKDAIPEKFMFVFQYFDDHLLTLARRDLSISMTKRILRDALCGIAELHDHNIVHTGSSPLTNKRFALTYLRQISRRTQCSY